MLNDDLQRLRYTIFMDVALMVVCFAISVLDYLMVYVS